MRISKSVMAVGGVVLAGMLIGFTNPKAVHAAVTALLVQVTNTATNPVVSSEVSRTAAQAVTVCSEIRADGAREPLQQIIAGGGFEPDTYVVPDGESFVITEMDITGGGAAIIQLSPVTTGSTGASESQIFRTSDDTTTHQFLFPSGIVWPSGQSIPFTATQGAVFCLRGYLTRA
ncbi:MAG TPA: hypothetical protein VLC51_03755 [Nitrospira sp.]|nr:hypothetical protein [Nitrospira sp.]